VKGGEYIVKSTSYVEPLFEVRLLPLATNLPMVCTPEPWEVARDKGDETLGSNVPPSV
jgi:hypothetical protein